MTPFRFEHDFRAPTVAAVFAAYFDPALGAEHDRRARVARREVLEVDDGAEVLRRVCRVAPERQLPSFLRPFVPGDLSFVEHVTWRKREDRIEQRIEPAILGGRTEILATYRVDEAAPGRMRRTFEGHVTVAVRLVGRRIERAIIDDLARSMQDAAGATQEWLDRQYPSGVILGG